MDYVIYTYGGGEVLWKIFNGLSIFFKSDSAYLTGVVKLSMVIGGLWAALRAIYSGSMGILARDYFIPTYLILNLFLLPKTSVHIVDEVSSDFKYSKIDHVPIGIAAVTSTASKLSRFITDRIENSLKTAEATHFGKTGPMFAAKLVAMSRDVRIIDPVERQNMKDFVRQCFTLPMVWTNILAGKKAALETDNILKLIAENPHSWLGSYWRTKGGDTEFLYCKGGVAKAREILNVEVPNGLAGLATDLFGNNKMDGIKSGQKLKTYFDTAWEELSHQAASAHEVAAQEMMMNAYREGLDDKRQEFGLERLNPHLVAYSSARARMQQNTGFLISSNLFALVGPSLQSTLFGILCVLFVIVVPMTMLPGGLTAFGMWVKLIIWVESWPVFYAIINCVSMMIASGKTTAYVKTGAGLSLLTQNGLADAAYDAYCYAEGFMCMVPVIAWAVISKSGYALANLAGTVTRGVDSLSSKMGSELTDGNMSFDNQSFHNRSVAGYQVAQQQLAPNFSFGSKYDDGRRNVTYDTQGRPIIQEAQTNLSTNVIATDNIADSFTESGQKSWQAARQKSNQSLESFNQGLNQLSGITHQFSKTGGMQNTFGDGSRMDIAEDLRLLKGVTEKYGKDRHMGDEKTFKLGTQGTLSIGKKGIAGLGGDLGGNVSAQDSEKIGKFISSDEGKQFSEALNRVLNYSKDRKGSLGDQNLIQSLESIQGNFQKAKMYQEQAQSSLTESENYNTMASFVRQNSGTITSNLNDEALAYSAEKRGMTIMQLDSWRQSHKEEYKADATEFLSKRLQPMRESLRTDHPMSEEQIKRTWQEFSPQVPNTVDRSDVHTARRITEEKGVGAKERQEMENDLNALRKETDHELQKQGQQIGTGKNDINKGQQEMEKTYKDRNEHGVAYWAGKRVYNEGIQTAKDIGEGAKEIGSWIEDKITPDIIPAMEKSSVPVSNPSPITIEKLSPTNDTPSFKDATPGVKTEGQPSYVQMETDIAQRHAQNRVERQERQMRELKNSMELSRDQTPSGEEPFDLSSSQIVDR